MWYKYSGTKYDSILQIAIFDGIMRQNNRFYIKTTVFLLIIAVLSGVFSAVSSAAQSKEMNMTLFEQKLASFKSDVYGNGSHYIDNASAYRGTQCYGFANQIALYFYGSFPTTTSNGLQATEDWVVNYGSSALLDLHVGDVMRFRSSVGADHSIFITDMDETYIYFSDCNNDHKNTVRHGAKKTWEELMVKIDKALEVNSKCIGWVAHYKYWNDDPEEKTGVTVSYNANGGYIEGEKTADRYVVTTSALRMRAGAGLDKEIITRMVNGTYFDVPAGAETVEADGYTWAPVTQGEHSGWAAISDPGDCRIDSPIMTADYYVGKNEDIYKSGTSNKYTEIIEKDTELASPEALGLKFGGAEFLGWATSPDGEPVTAEQIEETGDIVRLYALWSGTGEVTDTVSDTETDADTTDGADMSDVTDTDTGMTETTKETAEETAEDTAEETAEETTEETTEETMEAVTTTAPPAKPEKGDTNGDGRVDNKDVVFLFVNLSSPDEITDPDSADVNEDGSINNKDVIALFRIVSGG